MSYTVPTLEELVREAMQRHRAELPGTDAFLWPNTEHVLMKTVAGLVHLNFQYLDWIKKQRFATEADGDELDNHGKPFGLTRKAATAAHGYVTITGTAATYITAGTQISRSDAVVFSLRDNVTIGSNGTISAYVTADEAGIKGNTIAATAFTPTRTNAAIKSIAVEGDGLGGGADTEDDESYRARILFRMRNPPRGGAAHDYVSWALSVDGVSRVWVDPLAYGPGTVGVWFMTDGVTANGIPSATSMSDVTSYIEANRPVTARVVVHYPIPAVMNVCITDIGTVSAPIRAQIATELADVFRRQVQVSMPSVPYTFPTNLLWQAIARITGSSTHKIKTPASDVKLLAGYIPVLGDITYSD